MKAVKKLKAEGVETNVTLIFSANQAILAAKAGAAYVSPFIGRLDDAGQEGMAVIREIVQIFKNYQFDTNVLVASVRHPLHVIEAGKIGAHVVTLPPEILGKMMSHPLTDKGLSAFLSDWEKVKKENPSLVI
jgi:transaldolase